MDEALFKKLSARLDHHRKDMVEMQRKLTAIPAIAPESGGKGEYARGKYLEPLLENVFDEVKPLHCKDDRAEGGIRPNYAAFYKGKSNEKTIWIVAHIDTVPPGDLKNWDHDPFEVFEKDGKLYGRGVEDNQQAIVTGFYAVKAMKDEGVRPSYNVGFLLVSDEEIFDQFGIVHVFRNHINIFGKNDMFIIPDGGDPEGKNIEIAEKTYIWLKFTTKGKQCHSAIPKDGINAHRAGAHLVVEMEKLYKKYPQKDPVYVDSDCCTMEPTFKAANAPNYNTIPGEDVIGFDFRLLPSIDPEEFLRSVRGICDGVEKEFGVKIEIETIGRVDTAPPTPMNSPLIKVLSKAAKEVNGVETKLVGISGFTFAQRLREKGFHAAVYSKILENPHQPNECCVIDYMVSDAKVWTHVFLNA